MTSSESTLLTDEAIKILYDQSISEFPNVHTCKFCDKIVIDLHKSRLQNWVRQVVNVFIGELVKLQAPPVGDFDEEGWWRRLCFSFRNVGPRAIVRINVVEATEAFANGCSFFECFLRNVQHLQGFGPTLDVPFFLDYGRFPLHHHRYGLNSIRCPVIRYLPLIKWRNDALRSLDENSDPGPNTDCCVFSPIGDPSENIAVRRPPNPSPCSEYSFALAKRWIANCISNHQQCRPLGQQAMPKRLIYVEEHLGSDEYKISLNTTSTRVDYAALSYCWGGPQQYVTTKANAGQPIRSVQLGRTIQDAIFVTYKLGLQFLWVDAICIAQDDDEEKAVEIGRMADIYQGSYVIISAARAASSREGFLAPLETDGIQFQTKFRCPDGTLGSVIFQPHNTEYSRFYGRLGLGPVMERAWCLQEHVLAPRLLMYTSASLQFRCRTEEEADGGNFIGGKSSFQQKVMAGVQSADTGIMACWQSIIKDYSARSLTVETDILPAISAVAQVCSQYLNSQYIAGLWTENFHQQLAWSYHPYRDKRDIYCGPSFSWVALQEIKDVPSELIWSTGTKGSLQLLNHEVHHQSPLAPYGAIDKAIVQVYGRLKRVRRYRVDEIYSFQPLSHTGVSSFSEQSSAREASPVDTGREAPQIQYRCRPSTVPVQDEASLDSESEWSSAGSSSNLQHQSELDAASLNSPNEPGSADSVSRGNSLGETPILDRNSRFYHPALLAERDAGIPLHDTRYQDDVPWIRCFFDTLDAEDKMRWSEDPDMTWCLELFPPGVRSSSPCDGLLLTIVPAATEADNMMYQRVGYYQYPRGDDWQQIEFDKRFHEDFEWHRLTLI